MPRGRGSMTTVLVTQPVHQHSYEAAAALAESGQLEGFYTSFFYDGGPIWGLPVFRRRVTRLRRWLERRSHPDVPPELVTQISRYQAAALIARRLPHPIAKIVESRMFEGFDRAVARGLSRRQFDAVHGFEGTCALSLAASRASGKVAVLDVTTSHELFCEAARESGIPIPARITGRIARERELADYLLAPSSVVRTGLERAGVPPDKIVYLPYGVSSARLRPPVVDDAQTSITVLFLGQVGHRKGIAPLVAAWRAADLERARLLIAGPVVDRHGAKTIGELPHTARYLGPVTRPEADSLMRDTDVFVLPSLAEGSALVTYEAMGKGVLCVVTPETGSVVESRKNGLIVPARDVDLLAAALVEACEHPELRARLGQRAFETIRDGYTWAHYRRRLSRFYEELGGA